MRLNPFLSVLLVLGSVSLAADSAKLYVALNGNDAWSGRVDTPTADGHDGPKLTLPAALREATRILDTLRSNNVAAQAADGVAIFVRDGVYTLEEPLHLGPGQSGIDAKRPLLIAAYPGEKPILSGGRRITGWRKVEGDADLWQTDLPAVRDGNWYFRQLFINGKRMQRARTPNQGFFRIRGASPQDKPVKLRFNPGEIKKAWADDGDVEVIALLAWADFRMQIRAVDDTENVATLSGDARPSNQESNARYFIENAPDSCDAAGEWYLTRKSGALFYRAQPGEDPNQEEVIASKLHSLVLMQGDFETKRAVHDVVWRGLTFSYTDWELAPTGYADTQAAIATRGDVRAEGAVDCRIEECTFAHLAGYALELGRGCQRNRVVSNDFFDVGAGGVRVGETDVRRDAFQANHEQLVTDNHMHELGRVYPPAVGVLVLQSGRNRIAHNHIHDLYYTAVSVGWNWGYQETPCRENIVEFNHLHDIGQAMLSDMGAVYTLGIQSGTVVRNNLIHDVDSFTYGGWGLYPDEGSTDIIWENNVVYRTKSAGFHQHYGRENLVRNNIFALGREHQLMRTREEQHLSFFFVHNIVYFDAGDLLGSNWKNDRYLMDFNLYFDARADAPPEALRFGGATLEPWRARGHDVHSVVADPLFVSADKFDFQLQPESPALKLGFRPIDLSGVGIRPKSQRTESR